MYRCWKRRCWMVQVASWAGPLNLGLHISLRSPCRYVDIHLPYTVITVGCIDKVEYPPEYWSSARDIRTGVEYGRDK